MTTATITVTGQSWDETPSTSVPAVATARFTTRWAGDLVGESTCSLTICYVDGDPADPQSLVGPYTGFEHVTGTLAGREGSFVLAARGDHRGGTATTQLEVVQGSGTGALAGLRGSGSYAAEAMEYTLTLDYELPE
ncbi:MAG: DUF3224 domain-containing protein [Jatrophihabitans sp.]|uniref:DUF3224 domain-containing protein n=1 Tax=Jatrophihabitans sp. TaxID=1932789 RepID=UPI003F7F0F29